MFGGEFKETLNHAEIITVEISRECAEMLQKNPPGVSGRIFMILNIRLLFDDLLGRCPVLSGNLHDIQSGLE